MTLPISLESGYRASNDLLTSEFGRCMGAGGVSGALILLTGPMGIGKTEWAKGVAQGLGIRGRVASPTFLYLQLYDSPAPGSSPGLLHADWDRVNLGSEDLEESLLEGKECRITLVEWGEKLPPSVTRSFGIRIHVSLSWDGEGRHIGTVWRASPDFEAQLLTWKTVFDACIRRLGVEPDKDRQGSVSVP
ncbi:MAG: tRNA (adenosine(37)-N6)-threonylcarbamoyltransferase complex ATPase subunit type 1 TsaE [Nitrospirota bacterium]|nr:tRNA (adenosine(37)-N6)-threonylcarbamoyltransferase complex ATPase subunit type 1 TsaE [Nitrospirota bacterium]